MPILLVLAVLVGGLFFGGRYAYDQICSQFGSTPDYAGPGTGQVLYEVKSGASSAAIGRDLKAQGVVKSVDAFTAAATQQREVTQHPGRLLRAEEADEGQPRRSTCSSTPPT